MSSIHVGTPQGIIDSVAQAAINLLNSPDARRLEIYSIEFTFNGVEVIVLKDDTVARVVEFYNRLRRAMEIAYRA